MRLRLIVAPLVLCSAPLAAQPAPQQQPVDEIRRALGDPAMTDKLFGMMETLSRTMLQLPLGTLEATAEGRKPNSADRRRTVGSETRMGERELHARIEAAKPMLQQGMKALGEALPSMMQGLAQAQQSIERAAANMPDPNYPKR